MKCSQCNRENNLKDRTANRGRCLSCNHPFAFEPTAMKDVRITDSFFMKAIVDLSANHTLFFTSKQFLHFLNNRHKYKRFNWTESISFYIFFSFLATFLLGGFLSRFTHNVNATMVSVLIAINFLCTWILFEGSNDPSSIRQTRRSRAISLQLLSVIFLLAGGYLSISEKSGIGYVLTPLISGLVFMLGIVQKRHVANSSDSLSITPAQIIDWLNLWVRSNGHVAKLLPKPEIALPAAVENRGQNPDVTDYSFDRLVVCNSTEITQMLIANNFHFENNCAILSSTGYPAAVFDTVLQMLRRNPDLRVYAFHDASPDGVSLIHQLKTDPIWFAQSSATVIDLGLLPRQVIKNSRNLFIHRTTVSASVAMNLNPVIRQNLTTAELAWLDKGNYVELESFTPQKLIQILNMGISNSRELDTSDAGGVIWLGDNSNNVYAVESFG